MEMLAFGVTGGHGGSSAPPGASSEASLTIISIKDKDGNTIKINN